MRDFLFICRASLSNLNSNNITVQHLRSGEESQIIKLILRLQLPWLKGSSVLIAGSFKLAAHVIKTFYLLWFHEFLVF